MTKAATSKVRCSLRGIVEVVFYSGPAFSAGRLRTSEGNLITFAGKVFARENDAVRLEGQWTNHPKYAYFSARTVSQRRGPCSLRGIVEIVFYSGPAFSAGRLRTSARSSHHVCRQGVRQGE